MGITLWDSEGLEKNVVDLQLREMSAFLANKVLIVSGESAVAASIRAYMVWSL